MSSGDSVLVQIKPGLRVWWQYTNAGLCRSCGKAILWCVTTGGRRMPVDEPASPGAATVSHFTTCADAGQWRTR